jgi:hypothetical protein
MQNEDPKPEGNRKYEKNVLLVFWKRRDSDFMVRVSGFMVGVV